MIFDRLNKILAFFKKVSWFGSHNAEDIFKRGGMFAEQGDYQKTLKYYEKAEHRGYSETSHLYAAKAICLLHLRRWTAAIEYAEYISEIEPDGHHIKEILSQCRKCVLELFYLGHLKDADSLVQSALQTWPSDSTLLVVKGSLEITLRGRDAVGERYMDEAFKYDNAEPGLLHEIKGSSLWYDFDKKTEALVHLEKAVALSRSKQNLLSLGYPLISVDVERAKNIYEELYSKDPEDTRIIYGLAEIFMLRGDEKKGLELARKGLVLKPTSDDLNSLMGFGYYRLGEYKESLRHYQRAFKQHYHDQAYICSAVAECYYALGSVRKARKWAEKALEWNPEFTEATDLLSKIENVN
jgi:tetratricopeptide (TPR) repeat protein